MAKKTEEVKEEKIKEEIIEDEKINEEIVEDVKIKDEKKKKKKKKKEKKKKTHQPGRIAVRIIAALMALCMIFAVAATCIFYIQYYL